MYLDHKGLVTVGIGHFLTTTASTHHLPFEYAPSSGKSGLASNEDKDKDWPCAYDQGAELRTLAEKHILPKSARRFTDFS